jgi:hypothetical protein
MSIICRKTNKHIKLILITSHTERTIAYLFGTIFYFLRINLILAEKTVTILMVMLEMVLEKA